MTNQLCSHGRKIIDGYICEDCSIQDRVDIGKAILQGFDKAFNKHIEEIKNRKWWKF